MRSVLWNGYTYWIGENAEDNTRMIRQFQESNPDYYWFHIADGPSAHVILADTLSLVKVKKERLAILKHGALLCKERSRVVQHEPVPITCCRLRHLALTSIPGEVVIKEGEREFVI